MRGAGKLLSRFKRNGLIGRRVDVSSAWHTRWQTAEAVALGIMLGAKTDFPGEGVSPLVDAVTRRAGLA
jgi:hypothetical protein